MLSLAAASHGVLCNLGDVLPRWGGNVFKEDLSREFACISVFDDEHCTAMLAKSKSEEWMSFFMVLLSVVLNLEILPRGGEEGG